MYLYIWYSAELHFKNGASLLYFGPQMPVPWAFELWSDFRLSWDLTPSGKPPEPLNPESGMPTPWEHLPPSSMVSWLWPPPPSPLSSMRTVFLFHCSAQDVTVPGPSQVARCLLNQWAYILGSASLRACSFVSPFSASQCFEPQRCLG